MLCAVASFLIVGFAFVAGLLLPGYLLARLLRSETPWLLAFPISLVALFHCVFFTGLAGLPVRFSTVAPTVVALDVVLAVACALFGRQGGRTRSIFIRPRFPSPRSTADRLALAFAGLMTLLLAYQCVLTPLSGYDTFFRWDYLAQRVLELQRFDFYPPVRPEHFKDYFYVDGFPPIVSFAYWWIYAAAGRHVPELAALVLVPQYALAFELVRRIARHLAPENNRDLAGAFAVALLATSGLNFRSIAIGQETGIIALSVLSMLYVLLTAAPTAPSAALAALCAASAAMCREYGLAYVALGAAVLAWRTRAARPAPPLLTFLAVASVAAGPWYLRTLLLTGNPFYSLRFLGRPVNDVFSGMQESYRPYHSFTAWTADRWKTLIVYLLAGAPLQLTVGLAGAARLLRRAPAVVAAIALVFTLWLYSTGYTNGGELYSTRTLTAAWSLLSITGALLLAHALTTRAYPLKPSPLAATDSDVVLGAPQATEGSGPVTQAQPGLPAQHDEHNVLCPSRITGVLVTAAISAAAVAAVLTAWIFPFSFFNPPPPGTWLEVGLHPHPRQDPLEELVPEVHRLLPQNCRILGDQMITHALLRQAGRQLVPPWSPEVAFLFDPTIPPEEATRRLRAQGICAVLYTPIGNTDTPYFISRSPFYAQRKNWKPLARIENTYLILLPE
jgi:hypothetical protein